MLRRTFFFTFLILLLAVPVLAQEVTPTPDPVIMPETTETVEVPSSVWRELLEYVNANLLVQIVAGIVIAGTFGGTFAMIIHRLDKRTKDAMEQQFEALPPRWQDMIISVIDTLEALATLGRQVTDGQPNTEAQAAALRQEFATKAELEAAQQRVVSQLTSVVERMGKTAPPRSAPDSEFGV